MIPVSVVVIGAGLIGPRHAELVLKNSNCSLFAIVDRSAKGPSIASSCGTLHFQSIHDMLEFCDNHDANYPDAAVVCTPNDSHAEITVVLAEKGIHVLVEKPMASSAVDCIKMIDVCEKNNVKLLIGHHRRFNPYISATKSHMHRIGSPVAVQGVWALKKHQAYFDEKAWRRSRFLGGGAILINLIHDLDLLQYLLGPVIRVYAELMPRQRQAEGKDNHVDEGAVLTLRFANGCCGTFLCSDNVTSPYSFEAGTGENPLIPMHPDVAGFYRIFGSSGTLSVPDLTLYHQDNFSLRENSWWNPIQSESLGGVYQENDCMYVDDFSAITPPSSFEEKEANFGPATQKLPKPFDLQLGHFINLITGAETDVKCSGYDALQSMLCIEAVTRSINQGIAQTIQTAEELRAGFQGHESHQQPFFT
ncbi:NAD(P)-binding protein [Metschnikowia bicuspidata var. bicuspidata NRRL YB-4993]|uniref:NAD(P)-binding protein n=1 Tax=Metschnikowia bicuspidata var. bicuspidata NRRL YB-4993 TaxID=869754 RepID=A0A1A0HHM5_9ASCO|nr:NAD(P)-binding protein [Metschnikowia bicuspidata var. bicuspidata NRRL YB-4993]OBA23506.1 NAD(P)-binding protein [Metschnikowia bicuspidata var. bicuspidata NRRL YB-4993]